MKLFASPGSPYARKAWATVLELGLEDRVEIEMITPGKRPPDYEDVNPLGKIPALRLDSGSVLIDSPVICEYLDDAFGGGRLLSGTPEERWATRGLAALADGVIDAAVLIRQEGMRPAALVSKDWIDAQSAKIVRGISRLAETLPGRGQRLDLAALTAICCLDWINLRFAGADWLPADPRLDAWRAQFAEIRSLRETMPG